MKSGAYAQVAAFRGTSFLFLLKGATKGRFCPIRRKKAYSKLGMSRLAESGCAKGQRRAVAGMARKLRRGLAVARDSTALVDRRGPARRRACPWGSATPPRRVGGGFALAEMPLQRPLKLPAAGGAPGRPKVIHGECPARVRRVSGDSPRLPQPGCLIELRLRWQTNPSAGN